MDSLNKLKINEYVSINQLKKKLKSYLKEQGYSEFKPSIFAKGLVITLVMILEEIISDCLKNTTKDKTGLYTINTLILRSLLNESDKYSFVFKFLRKYNNIVRYHESIFFNIKKVMDNLETKHGSKLMIDSESRNLICFLLLNLQYDIVDLALKFVKYANRKTLNNQVLDVISNYMLSDDLSCKIKLKLDSSNIDTNNEEDDDEDDEDDDQVEVEVEDEDIAVNEDQFEEVDKEFEEVIEEEKDIIDIEIKKSSKKVEKIINDEDFKGKPKSIKNKKN